MLLNSETASPPATSGETLTVASKVPQGLLLRAFEWVEETENGPAGPKRVRVARPIPGASFRLNGLGDLHHLDPNKTHRYAEVVADFPGGYSLTHGVPADIWRNWSEFNRDLVESGVVFAVPSPDDAVIEGKSRSSIRSGQEPIDPDHIELTVPATPLRNPVGAVSGPQRGVIG
jgi:hypothetical protein